MAFLSLSFFWPAISIIIIWPRIALFRLTRNPKKILRGGAQIFWLTVLFLQGCSSLALLLCCLGEIAIDCHVFSATGKACHCGLYRTDLIECIGIKRFVSIWNWSNQLYCICVNTQQIYPECTRGGLGLKKALELFIQYRPTKPLIFTRIHLIIHDTV